MKATGTTTRICHSQAKTICRAVTPTAFLPNLHAQYVEKWEAEHPDRYGEKPLTDNLLYEGAD